VAAPTLTANTPQVGAITWSAFTIQYAGVSFPIPTGWTGNKLVWWLYNGGAGGPLQAGDILPTLGADDLLLFLNKNGTPVNAVSASIVDGSIIVTGSILADAIAANTLTGGKLIVGAVSAREVAANAITATQLAANSVVADKLAANSVIAGKVAADSITATEIAARTITAAELVVGTITAASGILAALSVTDANIANLSVGKLVAGSLTADITLSAQIKTADTGARVVLSALGLRAFNAAGALTVAINTDGTASFTGTITGSSISGSRFATSAGPLNSEQYIEIAPNTAYVGAPILQAIRFSMGSNGPEGVNWTVGETVYSGRLTHYYDLASPTKTVDMQIGPGFDTRVHLYETFMKMTNDTSGGKIFAQSASITLRGDGGTGSIGLSNTGVEINAFGANGNISLTTSGKSILLNARADVTLYSDKVFIGNGLPLSRIPGQRRNQLYALLVGGNNIADNTYQSDGAICLGTTLVDVQARYESHNNLDSTAGNGGRWAFFRGAGFAVQSDERSKTGIESLEDMDVLRVLRQAPATRWKRKDNGERAELEDSDGNNIPGPPPLDIVHLSPMAQDIPAFLQRPMGITGLSDGLGYDLGDMVGLLWETCRRLDQELDQFRKVKPRRQHATDVIARAERENGYTA
jgi:hypothetical protein